MIEPGYGSMSKKFVFGSSIFLQVQVGLTSSSTILLVLATRMRRRSHTLLVMLILQLNIKSQKP